MYRTYALSMVLAALVPAAAAQSSTIDLTFSGEFTSRTHAIGMPAEQVNVPFDSQMRIFSDAPQFTNYPNENTSETDFRTVPFQTTLTPSLLAAYPVAGLPQIRYFQSVFWFGYSPPGTRNEFMSFATGSFVDLNLDKQWVYQLVIRSDLPLSTESPGPISGDALFEALTFAHDTGQTFRTTEFVDVFSVSTGQRLESDWYEGSARVATVSAVPEPTALAIYLCGISMIAMRRVRQRANGHGAELMPLAKATPS